MKKEYEHLLWEREGNIGVLRFNFPEARNALSSGLQEDLLDFLPKLNHMEGLHALVLTGEGKAFSAGGDMNLFVQNYGKFKERGGVRDTYQNRVGKALYLVEIPIIAAVNGPAIGAGLTLTLSCDIRIASENAVFGAGFARVGISPEYGSSLLLSRTVGLSRATEMILTARMIRAQDALAYGLVTEVVSSEQLLPRSREVAREIADLPPYATRMCKRVLRHGLDCTVTQAMDYEELVETLCFTSRDHEEAARAFLEKRKPEFLGY